MAVQRSVSWLSEARVDVPDMRAIESAVRNDFDQLVQGFVTGTVKGYFVRGFNILMSGAIGGAASGLQMNVDPGALLHIASSQSGTIYMVPAGTLPQQLNSATNVIVDGAFAPSAVNYVSVEYERFIDDTTSAQVYLWNPTTNNETTKNVPRAIILRYRIKITTATPASNYLPVATVITDSNNNVISITDDRPLIGRLGSGGVSPNPFNTYSWLQGRNENPSTSTSNSVDPFSGGDKVIGNLKEWMDAVMSSLMEIKGTTYWYSISSSGSLESLREDLGNTVITGKGSIAHGVSPVDKITPTAPGQINWDQDINIKVIGSELIYALTANPSSTDISLSEEMCAYITLVRGIVVTPNLIFTNGLPQVTSVGAISWTGPLQSGDFVKLGSDTNAGYYKILTVDSLTQVTLTTNFTETSTGPAGAKGKYAFGSYQTSPTPSTNRHIFITSRQDVPIGEDVFWLFLRTDNGGIEPRVYIKFLGAELDNGEDRDIDGTTSEELLVYIGAPSESAFAPQYVNALAPGSLPEIQTLTFGTSAQIAQNAFFLINSSADSRSYYVWFNKDAGGTDPNPGNTNASIVVPITTGMTAVQIAAAVTIAFNSHVPKDFLAVQQPNPNDNKVKITNASAGSCQSALDFNMGSPFAVVVNQVGTGQGNFFINDGDSLTLAIKKLDEEVGSLASLETYDEVVEIVASGATPPTSLNGPVTAATLITLPNNSRAGNVAQFYTVGKGVLLVFLNGQFLDIESGAYSEVGTSGSSSNQIQINYQLEIGDELEIRFGGGSGGGGGAEGPPGPPGIAGPPGANAAGGPVAISTKISSYTVLLTDCFLRADCASGAIVFTLPPAATANGRIFYLKKVDSSANSMTVMGNGVELIDGLNTQVTVTQNDSYSIISNGASYDIF